MSSKNLEWANIEKEELLQELLCEQDRSSYLNDLIVHVEEVLEKHHPSGHWRDCRDLICQDLAEILREIDDT